MRDVVEPFVVGVGRTRVKRTTGTYVRLGAKCVHAE
jgi:hypothetical protein